MPVFSRSGPAGCVLCYRKIECGDLRVITKGSFDPLAFKRNDTQMPLPEEHQHPGCYFMLPQRTKSIDDFENPDFLTPDERERVGCIIKEYFAKKSEKEERQSEQKKAARAEEKEKQAALKAEVKRKKDEEKARQKAEQVAAKAAEKESKKIAKKQEREAIKAAKKAETERLRREKALTKALAKGKSASHKKASACDGSAAARALAAVVDVVERASREEGLYNKPEKVVRTNSKGALSFAPPNMCSNKIINRTEEEEEATCALFSMANVAVAILEQNNWHKENEQINSETLAAQPYKEIQDNQENGDVEDTHQKPAGEEGETVALAPTTEARSEEIKKEDDGPTHSNQAPSLMGQEAEVDAVLEKNDAPIEIICEANLLEANEDEKEVEEQEKEKDCQEKEVTEERKAVEKKRLDMSCPGSYWSVFINEDEYTGTRRSRRRKTEEGVEKPAAKRSKRGKENIQDSANTNKEAGVDVPVKESEPVAPFSAMIPDTMSDFYAAAATMATSRTTRGSRGNTAAMIA